MEQLYKALYNDLLAFFRRRTGSQEKAEDLAQETFLKLLSRLEQGATVANAEAYLFRTARNLLVDHYRGDRETEPLPELSDRSQELSEESEVREEIASWMSRFIGYLPDRYRETLRLADIEGIPYSRIALRLEVTEGTIKSRVHRGRKLLHKELIECCRFARDATGRVVDYEPLGKRGGLKQNRPAEAGRSECSGCS